ncbi:MAG: hypothetical protein IJR36_08210 [Lachnospiraceae bacterium]|nr:hypothetical protein [Lachnospiraceae bacterium]MBQ9562740.1 hypothetical protein [Lachnospiraceae bacterium]MBQ9593842.1 hypothetical protein [Lachnospiraceae bacterium]
MARPELKRRRIKNVPITEYPGLHHEWRVWDMAVEDFIRRVDPETVRRRDEELRNRWMAVPGTCGRLVKE